MKRLVAFILLVAPMLPGAQQQPSNTRSGWPCTGRIDPSYFRVAEGTGGHLLLVAPDEIGESAPLLTAFDSHRQTIFRLAGSLKPGTHELRVPIDSSVESAVFSISVQCLQVAQVLRPSGVQAGGSDVTDLWNFRAQRMVIVARPESGTWTIRVSGSGVSGIVVQARSTIGLSGVEFAAAGTTAFKAVPSLGVENLVKIRLSGEITDVRASVVNADFRKIADLPLEAGETDGLYVSRFTPSADDFRVLITGKGTDGVAFRRMHAPLLTPQR